MRTYLPYADFAKCAKCFTMQRLTKQRHDALEIIYLLTGRNHPTRGDRFMYNSPPKKVWVNCPLVLIDYIYALCDEYESRTGKPDPVRERAERRERNILDRGMTYRDRPGFLTSEAMHNSHRAILARQDEQHYGQFGFERDRDDEKVFYWPVEEAHAQWPPPPQPRRPAEELHDDDSDECNCDSCREARGE